MIVWLFWEKFLWYEFDWDALVLYEWDWDRLDREALIWEKVCLNECDLENFDFVEGISLNIEFVDDSYEGIEQIYERKND